MSNSSDHQDTVVPSLAYTLGSAVRAGIETIRTLALIAIIVTDPFCDQISRDLSDGNTE